MGFKSNIQDRAVISTVPTTDEAYPADVLIGNHVTVGHGALLTSCTVKDNTLIGQGAIIQEGAVIEENSIIAAGAVVLPGTLVKQGQLWAGNPAAYVRDVTEHEIEDIKEVRLGILVRVCI